MTSLKCYKTLIENNKSIDKLIECPIYEGEEKAKSCGSFKNSDGTQYDCASEDLLKKHGVISGDGCADNLFNDETGEIVDVEICYCSTDGCNRNCTCTKRGNIPGSNIIWFNPFVNGSENNATSSFIGTNSNSPTGIVSTNPIATEVSLTTVAVSNATKGLETVKNEEKGIKTQNGPRNEQLQKTTTPRINSGINKTIDSEAVTSSELEATPMAEPDGARSLKFSFTNALIIILHFSLIIYVL